MNDSEEIQRLIRLKRYESPGEEYFQNFLEEFKDRQRSELLHRSARSLLVERVSMWFSEYHGSRWLIPAGATAALVAGGFYFAGLGTAENTAGAAGFANSDQPSDVPVVFEPPGEGEVISLQLPRPGQRVPGAADSALPGAQGILPVGAKGTLREL